MSLLNTINKFYGEANVTSSEKYQGLFICEKKNSSNKTYQIIFIDSTKNWLGSDYSKYLENIVVDKYYQVPGFLQWNFYYFIIANSKLIKDNSTRKREIEQDETYTRKEIISETQFEDWLLSWNKVGTQSRLEDSSDLYSNWINTLKSNKLFFIYNFEKYKTYKQPVEDFIDGISFEDIDEFDSSVITPFEPQLNKINRIELLKYRDFPLIKDYSLGRVNLIKGVNAVGKTSLFDAIELTLTGKLKHESDVSRYEIKLIDSDNNIWKYPTKSTHYKQRDIEWYKSGLLRGNKLNMNFNRFNYYNSDASFQLKYADEKAENNFENIIVNIALGEEINKLEERISAFKERFNDQEELLTKELESLKQNLQEKTNSLRKIKDLQKDPESYMRSLLEALNNNLWKKSVNSYNNNFVIGLDNDIQYVLNSIKNIRNKNISIDSLSISNVEEELKQLNYEKDAINVLNKEILDIERELIDCESELERIQVILSVVEEFSVYIKHEHIELLGKIDDDIIAIKKSLSLLSEIKNISQIIKIESAEYKIDKATNIDIIIENVNSTKKDLENKYNESKIKINQIEEGVEKLSIIVNNIKSQGLQYIKLNPTAEECPLCNTHFQNNSLVKSIESTKNTFANSNALLSLKNEISEIENQLKENDKKLEILSKMQNLLPKFFDSNSSNKTINEIEMECDKSINSISSVELTLNKLIMIQTKLKGDGLTKERYTYLLNYLKDNLALNIANMEDLNSKTNDLSDKRAKKEIVLLDLKNRLESDKLKRRNLFTSDTKDESNLNNRINELQEVIDSFAQISELIETPNETLFKELQERINRINTSFELYKNELSESRQASEMSQTIDREIKDITDTIKDKEPRLERAKFANTVLTQLIKEQNKNDFLSSYINDNREDIVSIFKLIHIPQEFNNISFNNNKITLTCIDGSNRTLNQISTGQRSALALSIFLSLNRKLTNGPNILIFDDPVTYVDDMNVLSFFDYLRELVLKTNRQIFFATANDDIAFLFNKKFEILQNELVVYELEREAN